MKKYTAIYDTSTYKGIKYDFEAANLEAAKVFTDKKFCKEQISNLIVLRTPRYDLEVEQKV